MQKSRAVLPQASQLGKSLCRMRLKAPISGPTPFPGTPSLLVKLHLLQEAPSSGSKCTRSRVALTKGRGRVGRRLSELFSPVPGPSQGSSL